MKIMIVYATTEGHTRSIAGFLEEKAEKEGHTVGLFDATVRPPSPEGYDAVIIASSVHMGKYQTAIEHYVREHHQVLNDMPTMFISVSLAAASDNDASWDELKQQTEDFMISTGLKAKHIEYVAGALLYTKYDFFKRFIMRTISKREDRETNTSQDYVYTDWDQVAELLKKLEAIAATGSMEEVKS